MGVRSFKDLIVWQKSMDVVEVVYTLSDKLPRTEDYALSNQMRRAATSIPSNIAEGCKRNNRAEYRQFCGIAQGSAAELETQLLLVARLYPPINTDRALELLTEVQKMLTNLIKTLKSVT